MARNRDLSKLLSTSNGKIAGTNLDVSFENITDTGTEGTKVAAGTTAQRGSTSGQFRFNSTRVCKNMKKDTNQNFITKEEANEMIETALRRHNRRSTIISSFLGWILIGGYSFGLFQAVQNV